MTWRWRLIKSQVFACVWVGVALFFLFQGDAVVLSLKPICAGLLPGGLRVSYYEGINFDRLICRRTERRVECGYSTGSPAWGVPKDRFSARWEGYLSVPVDDMYFFKMQSDDGSRLYINNELIIDYWSDHGFSPKFAKKLLAIGKYPIRIEYYDKIGDARIRLKWNGTGKIILPGAVLAVPYISKR
ncbi:MAG: hypothetical protein HQ580_10825 [Planctomycetes bacterium]|nr:hypothetical protein [Planctomycetota bacterium]